jgi:uncharacterized protein (TIGR03435 family)
MLRALLAERFHLRVHKEDQPERVYLLQVGPHGLKLQESTGNSTAPSGCFGQMTCRKATMATLARALRANGTGVDAPVVDETGLKGSYDLTLQFVVDARATLKALGSGCGLSSGLAGEAATRRQRAERVEIPALLERSGAQL